MKDIYLEITFWVGATVLVLGLLYAFGWLFVKVVDGISGFFGNMYIVYEYLVYRREFEEWIVKEGKQRNNRVIEWKKKKEAKKKQARESSPRGNNL